MLAKVAIDCKRLGDTLLHITELSFCYIHSWNIFHSFRSSRDPSIVTEPNPFLVTLDLVGCLVNWMCT